MMQPTLRKWLGASVLGSALVVGCSHSHQECASCSANRPIASGYVQTMPGTYAGPSMSYMPQRVVAQPMPQTPVMQAPAAAATPAAAVLPPPVEPAPAPVSQVSATVPAKPEAEPAPAAGYTLTGGEEKPIARRSYADITAKPGYGHAPDYSWVTGELQFVHVRSEWRVRYASVDEEDRYGGSLTLTEMGSMSSYSDGQMVRVTGRVIHADEREPLYRVGSIQVLHGAQ
jgi:hypothetical protein